jgi:DNA polymerase-1
LEEAERMRTAYLNKVHVFVKWCNDVIAFARKNGYVTTLFGRRRPVPDIWAEDNGLRAEAERVAVNTPIQGTAADLTMMALVRFNGELKKRGLRAVPVVTVHDSIVVDVPADEVAEVGELLLRCMEDTSMYPWAVIPFTADIKVDRSWDASSKKLTKTHDSQLDYEVDEEEEDDVGDES